MDTRKNIFLTGASSGIGLETARLLAEQGFHVWGASRDIKRLPTLPNFHPVAMDLTDLKSVREAFAAALQQAGHFDVLINNAGAGTFGPLEAQTDEQVREHFQLLVHGPLELIRLALPQMRQRQRGLIINVSSLAARFPVPYLGPYNAAKAALVSLSESLRIELAHTPIRVIDLQPANINTNFQAATRRIETTFDQDRVAAAWRSIEAGMAAAPPPQLAARAILKIINSPNPPPVVTVGSFFQAHLGPIFARFGSARLNEWVLRRYYKIS